MSIVNGAGEPERSHDRVPATPTSEFSPIPIPLMYALRAAAKRGVFENEGNTSTIVHLTAEKLRAHRLPWPPVAEQHEIVTALDAEKRLIDASISALDRQIALLLERRQALITAAVTGSSRSPEPRRRVRRRS